METLHSSKHPSAFLSLKVSTGRPEPGSGLCLFHATSAELGGFDTFTLRKDRGSCRGLVPELWVSVHVQEMDLRVLVGPLNADYSVVL